MNGSTKSCGECSYNKFEFVDDYVIGYTTTNNIKFTFDIEDFDRVSKHTWRIIGNGSLGATINKKTISLHKFILEYYINEYSVDHIDGNPSNNRKNNLRLVTTQQNGFNQKIRINNTSGVTGVWYSNNACLWYAEIKINGKKAGLKGFIDKNSAIRARVSMEFKYFGEEYRRGQLDETNEIVKDQVRIEKEKLKAS